jgi:Mn-dependent DtxR family transcriptional regulator
MDITPKQREYLLYLASSGDGARFLPDISARFGVSKPSALSALAGLERLGLVARGAGGRGSAELTDLGRHVAVPLAERAEDVAEWLRDFLMFSPEEAGIVAAQLVCSGPASVAEHILRRRSVQLAERGIRDGDGLPVSDGLYDADFTVRKSGGGEASMGDRGFHKPARLTVHGGRAALELRSKLLRYKPQGGGEPSRGSLRRLWYLYGGEWEEAPRARGAWHIPGGAIAFEASGGVATGRVAIRARAGGTVCAMPDSEAEVAFTIRLHPDDG